MDSTSTEYLLHKTTYKGIGPHQAFGGEGSGEGADQVESLWQAGA